MKQLIWSFKTLFLNIKALKKVKKNKTENDSAFSQKMKTHKIKLFLALNNWTRLFLERRKYNLTNDDGYSASDYDQKIK